LSGDGLLSGSDLRPTAHTSLTDEKIAGSSTDGQSPPGRSNWPTPPKTTATPNHNTKMATKNPVD